MTTSMFFGCIVIGCVLILLIGGIVLEMLVEPDGGGFICSALLAIIYAVAFSNLAPSFEEMTENDYYAMLEDRPKCIDTTPISFGCKKEYNEWLEDSIKFQRRYDSVAVILGIKQTDIIKEEK